MRQKTLLIVTAGILLLTFIAASMIYKRYQAGHMARMAEQNSASVIRAHAPTLGSPDAPVVIVEFFDPACGTCQAFYEPVKGFLQDHPGKIRLVLRYAPFHEGSEKIVALLEAARKQDKFWPVLDVLMETQDDWKPLQAAKIDLVWPHLKGLELNLDQLRADMNDPAIPLLIAQDIKDANTLNIDTTPEFFVNGEPLPRFGFGPLKQRVDEAVKAAAEAR